jgi:hypothetical protein
MATIENRVTQDGDVLLIRAEAPIVGLIYLTDFIDATEGEDRGTNFRKEFRYATDGINFAKWTPLTAANVAAVKVRSSDTFLIEYRYTRQGNGPQNLAFNAVEVRGKLEPRECGPVYKQSIFADFFSCSDTEVLGWAINVTEKIYRKGLLPSFVERSPGTHTLQDRDYLDFWRTVAQFFAFIVLYARQLERLHQRPEALQAYLTQWGLFAGNDISLDKLVYLLESRLDQFRQRGTAGVVTKGEVNGEVLRLIGYQENDELLVNVVAPPYAAWCVGFNAPTYRGVGSQPQLNKVPQGVEGFGTRPISINPCLTYEVSFTVKTLLDTAFLDFGLQGFDQYGQPVSFKDCTTGKEQNWFFIQARPLQSGVEYQVRGLIYRYNKPNQSVADSTLAFGTGQHLRSQKTICQVVPIVRGDVSADQATLNNFRLAPCSSPTSLGFVDSGRFTQVWLQNRNTELSETQLAYRIKHFLLPYNASLLPVFIPQTPPTVD